MEHDYWAKRWTEGQIGFHEGLPNDLLGTHMERLETKTPLRILVPLAGKAVDLRWLADRGHEVVGVEFVPEAITSFFAELGVEPVKTQLGGLPASSGKGVTLVGADMFHVTAAALGTFDLIYDRAALVALEPATCARYVSVLESLLGPGGEVFLIAFAYDQSKAPGPPWSVDEATVRALHAGHAIEILSTRSVPTSGRLSAAGVTAFEETAYLVGTTAAKLP